MEQRIGSCIRKTKETDISLKQISALRSILTDRAVIRLIQESRFLIICWTGLRATGSLTWM